MRAARRLDRAVRLICARCSLAPSSSAPAAADTPQWRLAQPAPPGTGSGRERLDRRPSASAESGTSSSGRRTCGALITDGNGSTVPPGIWVYNGQGWHELAEVCGATDGRIAWAGPDEILDGLGRARRPGGKRPRSAPAAGRRHPLQVRPQGTGQPGLAAGSGRLLRHTRIPANSYQPMHAAACMTPERLLVRRRPAPRTSARRIPPALERDHAGSRTQHTGRIGAGMRVFQGSLYESIGLTLEEPEAELTEQEILHPSVDPGSAAERLRRELQSPAPQDLLESDPARIRSPVSAYPSARSHRHSDS